MAIIWSDHNSQLSSEHNESAGLVLAPHRSGAGCTPKGIRIDADGNVGIGTKEPSSTLTVNGDVQATNIIVKGDANSHLTVKGKILASEIEVIEFSLILPDYVFKDSYKLSTLSEVEDYINVNGHLSEIPSAEEIEKNGMSLGDMNILLLKKVEELTLYAIEQEKRISILEKTSIKQ